MTSNIESNVQNRSEIVFLYDAEDANPNGNPISDKNRPRQDEVTGEAIVTDVRMKRYLRDQMDDDGISIYLRNPQRINEGAKTKDTLFMELMDMDSDEIADMDPGTLYETFLDQAADVRYFGATLAFNNALDIDDLNPPQFTGPVQLSHGRSLNEVFTKHETSNQSPTVANDEGDNQGTFAADHRLQYALVNFHGIVNEVAADNTALTTEDVERLDTLFWRSLKNQTLTRSKIGHEPRLYLRVEYDSEYYNGQLDDLITIDEEHSESDEEMRNISDVVLDATSLIQELEDEADRIKSVSITASKYAEFAIDGEVGGPETLYNALDASLPVEVIDVYA